MEKPSATIQPANIINEIPNYELILNTVKKEEKPFSEYDNISFEKITSFEKNKILIKIYNELIWGAEISLPKFAQLEDLFIIIEYLFRRPFFNGYVYNNNNEENIIDYHIISRIREIYKFLSGMILDILIAKNDNKEKKEINNIINNEDNDTKIKQEKEKEKENNYIKKLCDILQINDEFFKYFCITIIKN